MTPEVRELLRKIAELKVACTIWVECFSESEDIQRQAERQLSTALGQVQGQAAIVRLYNEYEEEACKPTSAITN